MSKVFDINQLYQQVFGYQALPYPLAFSKEKEQVFNAPAYTIEEQEPNPVKEAFPWAQEPDPANNVVEGKSLLIGGRAMNRDAVRMATRLVAGDFVYDFPNEPIVSCSGGFDVITTMLYGDGRRKGSVKEVMMTQDYTINIRGLLVNLDQDDFAEADIKDLRRAIEYRGAITIDNLLCKSLGITQATVTKFDYRREEGEGIRYQRYEIALLSDQDFDLDFE